jgi:nucleoside-diphosphate-sugar epimerase
MSSSVSTRFPYPNPEVNNLTEDKLCAINGGDYAPVFIQPYAETKAMGEKLIREACGTEDLRSLRAAEILKVLRRSEKQEIRSNEANEEEQSPIDKEHLHSKRI